MVSQDMLKVYNSLTKRKETFKPIKDKEIGIYVCGVTVYDFCHIGHARTYISFDIIVNYLRSIGYKVNYVRNITDIEDKIIKRSMEKGIKWKQLVDENIEYMDEDFLALNIKKPCSEPKATEFIKPMINMISKLIEKNNAYIAKSGDVLFRVNSFSNYGMLSGQKVEELENIRSIQKQEDKDNPADFVLWKMSKENEPSWDSPWGKGRPGWHIECSVMTEGLLGKHFDIHGGGSDLKFPHHENEIAQSCCANETKFCNYWLHTGMVMVDKEKMSKSLNNFFTIRDVLKEYDPEVVRYFLSTSHYRSRLNYSKENLNQAKSALDRIYNALVGINFENQSSYSEHTIFSQRFNDAMNDDFNTPEALAVIFDLVKEINKSKETDIEKAKSLASELMRLCKILGILNLKPEEYFNNLNSDSLRDQVEELIKSRNEARKEKNWAKADMARDKLNELGVILEDSSSGTSWKIKDK